MLKMILLHKPISYVVRVMIPFTLSVSVTLYLSLPIIGHYYADNGNYIIHQLVRLFGS